MDRSHLLQGLRSGGPRANAFATQPGQQPGGPRFQNGMYGDESDFYQQQINLAQGMPIGGATLQQQQQQLAMLQAQAQMAVMMQAQGGAPTRDMQALQMQMEVIRLQALQQQKTLQAQFIIQSQLASQNRRRSEQHQLPSVPSTPTTPSSLDPMAAQTRMAAANQLRARAIGREASAMSIAAASEEQVSAPSASVNLNARAVSTPLNPNAAAFVGRLNPNLALNIAASSKSTASADSGTPSTPTYGSTTVISGGTSLGSAGCATPTGSSGSIATPSSSYNGLSGYNSSPVATSVGPTKSDSAMSWRRGSSTTPASTPTQTTPSNGSRTPSPPLRQRSTSPPTESALPSQLSRLSISSNSSSGSLDAPLSAAPSSAVRIRPSPLRFMKTRTEEEQVPVAARSNSPSSQSTDGGKEENDAGSANGSSPTSSTPPSSAASEDSNNSQKKEREEASKRLYEGLGLGRPMPSPKSQTTFNVHAAPFTLPPITARAVTMPAPVTIKQEPLPQPHRQPIGPPSSVDELGPRNFASRLRKKALGGLGVLMDARDRREGCPGVEVTAF